MLCDLLMEEKREEVLRAGRDLISRSRALSGYRVKRTLYEFIDDWLAECDVGLSLDDMASDYAGGW